MSTEVDTQHDDALRVIRARLAAAPGRLFIDGRWQEAFSRRQLSVQDPSTGEEIAVCAEGDAEDIDLAVAAARRVFMSDEWRAQSGERRAALLFKFADLLEANSAELTLLEALDTGNTITSIRYGDLPAAIYLLREAAGWATKIAGSVPMVSAPDRGLGLLTREPVGVVGVITPWNAPLVMLVQKIAPAIAAGCTVVAKSAELAPLSSIRIAELVEAAAFPAGAFNLVTGAGAAGQALADHPDVNKISFTGSTTVGKSVLAAAARTNLKRVTLELGGKSPIIVFPDADLDAAAQGIVQEILFKSGQFCMAGTRLLVAETVQAPLLARIEAGLRGIVIGAGYAEDSHVGPMISQKQRDRAFGIVRASIEQGAKAALDGGPMPGRGFFFRPMILADVTRDMPAVADEIFAPVIAAETFAAEMSLDAIAAVANDTTYGLSAKIWTKSLGSAHGLARRLEAGMIYVNGGGGEGLLPIGGYKQSGIGREYGLEGILSYTELKSISIGF